MSFIQAAVVGMNALGQVQQGRYANAQAKLQGSVLDYQAKQEQDAAIKTAEIIRRAGRRQVGQATAAYAGAGVVVGQGSAGEAEREITQDYEADAFQALLEGGRRGDALRTEASMSRASGRAAQSAGMVAAFSTVLGDTYGAMKANGWRSNGPGFSGTQAPAPIIDKSIRG
jgi:hypothetical protein